MVALTRTYFNLSSRVRCPLSQGLSKVVGVGDIILPG